MAVWPVIASLWTWTMLVLLFLLALPLMALARLVLWPFDKGHYVAGRIFRIVGATSARINPLWKFTWSGPVPANPRRPYVVVSNHESTADIMLISHLPWEMKWLAKREMFRIPVLGWLMWLAGDIGVRRGSARSAVEAMRECRDRLEKKVSVMIFPEGTRSTTEDLLPFKDGAFRLAVETQLPILPLALAGTRDALPKRGFVMNRARAHVQILEPIETAGMSVADVPALRDQVRETIGRARRSLKQEKVMRRVLSLPLVALLVALPVANAQAQQLPSDVDSMMHRLFASREFASQRFGPARWIENGAAYTTVERSEDVEGASDIVRYETASGERSVLVSASQLVPEGDSAALGFDDYVWSPDNSKLMIFTNTEKVWRQNSRGDYWVLDRKSGKLQQLGGDAEESTLMYAKFSPQGDRVAYVMKGDIYVERLSDGNIARLTTGADSLHVNGMSDWVYEEEFGLRDGFRWSPDGERIAFWHFDMTGVGTFLLINDTDSLYPFVIPIQYPKAGTTNSAVTAGVVSATGGNITWLDVPGDPRDDYLPWMEWAGKDEVMIQRVNRRQNAIDFILANAATGATRSLFVERDSAWVDLIDEVPQLDDASQLLWTSERDGWRRAYQVNRSSGNLRPVTTGNFDMISVSHVDEDGGWLYYIAAPGAPTQRFLYRSRLNGRGQPERVTPASSGGTHSYSISPDAKWAIHNWSDFDTPSVTDLIALPSHRVVRTLVANDTLKARVAPFVASKGDFFRVAVSDGVELDGWMIRPTDFDSTRKYPLLMYVYGEPAGQTARDGWMGTSRLWYQYIADQGYLVASVDNRGTPSPRGREWRKVIYGAVGELGSEEQAEAVRALAEARSYVDATRVGIWGWSGGGTSTLNAMFRYPDVYQVGMSVAPVPDQRLYDTIYQERYMGTPQDNLDGYKRGSPIWHAEGLEGELLVVHGSGDDNVHYQGTERLVNRLVELGKQFDLMVYPNRSHCICEGRGTSLNVYSLLTRYLLTHLEPGAK